MGPAEDAGVSDPAAILELGILCARGSGLNLCSLHKSARFFYWRRDGTKHKYFRLSLKSEVRRFCLVPIAKADHFLVVMTSTTLSRSSGANTPLALVHNPSFSLPMKIAGKCIAPPAPLPVNGIKSLF